MSVCGRVFVRGEPLPKGSSTRMLKTVRCHVCGRTQPPGVGRLGPHVHQANLATKTRKKGALDRWEETIAATTKHCAELWRGEVAPRGIPVELQLRFALVKPPSNRLDGPAGKPDVDKLARAVCDALTGVIYEDDSQICALRTDKQWGPVPGVAIEWRWARPQDELKWSE